MFDSFHAIHDASVNIGQHEEDHSAEHGRDEEFIEQVDVIHDRVVLRAGFVVAHPRGGEVGSGIGVAALAFDKQVLLHANAGFGIVYSRNVVQAVAIGANRFIGGLAREFFFEEFYGGAVEV